MSVNRAVWKLIFDQTSFPGLPCPQCPVGKMKLVPGSFHLEEPEFSKRYHSHDDFEPDWVEERFSARLKCDEVDCGEVVSIAGNTCNVPVYLEDEGGYTGWAEESKLRARSVYPAPPLFRMSDEFPYAVREQLRLGFQLFWTDYAACVGRLRTAVELMLDQQKVSKTVVKKGKPERASLWDRIELFSATLAADDMKDSLHALRNIGNLGTHGTEVTQEALFDAADVLEDVLLGVYEKKSVKAKATKLNATKGKYQ